MSPDEARDVVVRLFGQIAPEADFSEVEPDEELRDQLDIDSMDFLNFIVALDGETGIDVPEADYPKLATLDGAVAYLVAASRGAA